MHVQMGFKCGKRGKDGVDLNCFSIILIMFSHIGNNKEWKEKLAVLQANIWLCQ